MGFVILSTLRIGSLLGRYEEMIKEEANEAG